MSITIRAAKKEDAGLVLSFIKKIAAYERLSNQVTATAEMLEEFVFEKQAAWVLIAEFNGAPCGFALFYENFSTFKGRTGLHLEDLFVDESMRGRGIGKALLGAVCREAQKRGAPRLEWTCLNWNAPSIAFYRYMGAKAMDEWTTFRLEDHEIALAENK